MSHWKCVTALFLLCVSLGASAQITDTAYSRKNTFTVFAEGTNNSDYIVAGYAQDRRIFDLGFAYARRVASFLGTSLSYQVELRPVLFESDPLVIEQFTETFGDSTYAGTNSYSPDFKCMPGSGSGGINSGVPGQPNGTYSYNDTCGRQWTFGQALAPFGFKYSALTRHRWQPFITGNLGYLFTSRPIPDSGASPLNFMIDLGAGVEVFQNHSRSVSLEYRVRHVSNHETAQDNPGFDNQLLKVNYSFGR